MATAPLNFKICWICGKVVYLTESETDESGLAVHETCYVMKAALAKAQQPRPARPRPCRSERC